MQQSVTVNACLFLFSILLFKNCLLLNIYPQKISKNKHQTVVNNGNNNNLPRLNEQNVVSNKSTLPKWLIILFAFLTNLFG